MKLQQTVLAVLVCSSPILAQEIERPKPTAAHQILAEDAGTWDCKVNMYFQGPDGPPARSQAVEVTELVSGGLYSKSAFHGKMGTEDFEGHGLLGYDPRSKEYVGTWVDNFTAVPTSMRGKYDPKTKQLTLFSKIVIPETGDELQQKQITTYVDDNTKKFEIYLLIGEGDQQQAIKLMEMTAKRRK